MRLSASLLTSKLENYLFTAYSMYMQFSLPFGVVSFIYNLRMNYSVLITDPLHTWTTFLLLLHAAFLGL
jgi:hypothetical protein